MRFIDLFGGAGGFSLGAKRAGAEVVAAFDHEQRAVDVYNANVGDHARRVDLKDIHTYGPVMRALEPCCLFGGPPCQDFSAAGEGVEGDNAAMTPTFAMLVCVVRPRWFVMENVPRARNARAYKVARQMLVDAGYGVTEVELDACYYGVAQRRVRLFLIGRLGEAHGFLESALRRAASEFPMTMRGLFGPDAPPFVYWHPRYPGKRGVFACDEPHPTVRNAGRPQPPGYVPHPADANYVLLQAGLFGQRPFYDGPCVHSVDVPAPTVIRTSVEGPRPRDVANPHPLNAGPVWRAVRLTRHQLSLVQGFPAWWDWRLARTLWHQDQFTANAVPSPLAEAIVRVIIERDAGLTCPDVPSGFKAWLHATRRRRVANNVTWRVSRAWEMSGGRAFGDVAVAIAALEASPEFQRLSSSYGSGFRCALSAWHEWTSGNTVPGSPRPDA